MKLILSPAKSIDTIKTVQLKEFSVSPFLPESSILVNKLRKFSVKKLQEMMHISTDLAELNYLRYKNWVLPEQPTDEIIPAVLAFNGEVYKGLDARSLTEEQSQNMQESVYILSGLYGVLKPMDLIFPYRLEMGTKWDISSKHKNLYAYWGKKIAAYLNKNMSEKEVLINLASAEYFKAVDKKIFKSTIITPVFKEFKNGEYKIVMMYAKHARGAMARYCIVNKIEDPEELKLYTVDGYSFDSNQSTENEWVFVR